MFRVLLFALAIFVACVALLALVAPVKAQCHGGRAVSVRVGGYASFVPVHRQVFVRRAVRAIVVKRVVALDVPQYYYSTTDHAQQQLIADAAAYRAFQMYLQAQQAYQQQQQQVPPQYPTQPCPTCQPGSEGDTGGIANQIQILPQQQAQPTGWRASLAGVVKQSCVKCHNGTANGVDLTDLSAVTPAQRGACWAAVKYGAMPKGHGKLPASTQRLFQMWAQSK